MAESLLAESIRSAGTDMIDFKGSDGRPELNSTLIELWISKELSDITLQARGTNIKAHKFILKAYCTKLKKEDLERSSLNLTIPSNILQLVLSYMYTNEVGIPKDDLKGVAEAAKELGVDSLYKQCMTTYLQSLTITRENALQMWQQAREVGVEDVEQKALTLALEQFVLIHKMDSFKSLPVHFLEEYVCHPELGARTKEERLSSAIAWVRSDPKRTHHLMHY